jgi:hypothetical protein
MTNEEAKFILSAYRPNGQDANDATFSAALEQARSDPGLGKWFELEQKFDRAMTTKLGSVLPPEGLRAAILAGSRVSGGRQVRTWWHQPKWLALAASVLVLLSVGALLWPNPVDAQELAKFALNDTAHEGHGGHGDDSEALQEQLSNPALPLGQGVKVDFASLKATGCRTIKLDGRDLLEVCFKRDGKWFHCYIGRRADFPKACTLGAPPKFLSGEKLCCASWSDVEHVYVVVGSAGLEAVKHLL